MTEAVKKVGRWTKIRAKLTYANVMSTIAGFAALFTGGAYAAKQLQKDSVGPKQIKKGAVASSEVKQSSLTGADVRDGSLGEQDLAFTALRLGDIVSAPVFLSNPVNAEASFTTIGTTTVTVGVESTLSAEGTVNASATGTPGETAAVSYRLLVDGNPVGGEFTDGLQAGTGLASRTSSPSFSTTLSPGTHSLEFQAKVDGAAGAIIGPRSFDAVARRF